jgi:hypothetical protein
MLSKIELIAELKNMMRTIGSITFESGVIQNELYEMMTDVVCDELKDGGILKWRLREKKDRLEVVLSHFNELVKRTWEREIDDSV